LGHGFFSVEIADVAGSTAHSAPLQLGHGFFSVEMFKQTAEIKEYVELQLGHGFFSVEMSCMRSSGRVSNAASIGPRIFLRGNQWRREQRKVIDAVLQLGHGFFSVEIDLGAFYTFGNSLPLQLGHGFFSVEINVNHPVEACGI